MTYQIPVLGIITYTNKRTMRERSISTLPRRTHSFNALNTSNGHCLSSWALLLDRADLQD
jgi:hypothetical protein